MSFEVKILGKTTDREVTLKAIDIEVGSLFYDGDDELNLKVVNGSIFLDRGELDIFGAQEIEECSGSFDNCRVIEGHVEIRVTFGEEV